MNKIFGLALLLSLTIPAFADGRLGTVLHVPVKAETALVVDADTNDVVYQKHPDDVRSIASITKLMTAMVTLDCKLPMDELITITQEDVDATRLHGMPTSRTLAIGTTLTREELLHLALMNSQNRAAAALARTYPGGMAAFVDNMNKKAAILGMNNTTFVDPTGLISLNKSTASDLAIMLNAAFQYDTIREFSTSTSYVITPTVEQQHKVEFRTTNRLLTKKDWNILLQKTGYIINSKHCVVMLTEIEDRRFTIILLGAKNNKERAADAIRIKFFIENGREATAREINNLNPYKKHYAKIRTKRSRQKTT